MPGLLSAYRQGGSNPPAAITYIGSATSAVSVSPRALAWPPGIQAGDFAVVIVGKQGATSIGISGGDGGWTYSVTGEMAVAYKFVTAGDLAVNPTVASTAGNMYLATACWRNATAVVNKGSQYRFNATIASVAGFTPASPGTVVSLLASSVPGASSSNSLTPPSGFAERLDYSEHSATAAAVGVADRSDYAGAAIAWASIGVSVANGETVLELT